MVKDSNPITESLQTKESFKAYTKDSGLLEDLSKNAFPARFYTWEKKGISIENKTANFCGYVMEGEAKITSTEGTFILKAGMYFSISEKLSIEGEGTGVIIEQFNYKGLFQIGGPIEKKGRLQYIDGCTDSLLISPPVLGNPCLNLLHIPPQTFQSQHTHPSFRIGVVVEGTGVCCTPEGEYSLQPGLRFMIPEGALHSFKTNEEALLVIAYHPDSDFGPTHENHPMINRTILQK